MPRWLSFPLSHCHICQATMNLLLQYLHLAVPGARGSSGCFTACHFTARCIKVPEAQHTRCRQKCWRQRPTSGPLSCTCCVCCCGPIVAASRPREVPAVPARQSTGCHQVTTQVIQVCSHYLRGACIVHKSITLQSAALCLRPARKQCACLQCMARCCARLPVVSRWA